MLRRSLIIALVLTLAVPALAAERNPDNGTINIMRPEQASPVKKKIRKIRRGSSSPVYPTPLPAPQAPLPPHMEQSWNLLGFDAKRYDPIEEAPEEG